MIGTVLANRYEIVREVGRGGMGVVYLARDLVLEREVAVKLLAPANMNDESVERFQREARVVAKMDHPGIIPLHDVVEHDTAIFLVMPFVQGASLRRTLMERTIAIPDAIEIGIQVAEALQYSHNLGVVHRDVKPENIMLERDEGGHLRVRVADFGVAAAEFEERVTKSGVIIGTGVYLSPEQISEGEIDGRTDIYALGVVLYECIAGRPPFTGTGAPLYSRIAFSVPRALSGYRDGIDPELDSIVAGCLEKSPSRRPQTARVLADALLRVKAGVLGTPVHNTPSSVPRPGASSAQPRSLFVGREKEYAELVDRLGQAGGGECQFVLVGGEAGIGKTRLVGELEYAARSKGARVLKGRCLDNDQSFPYQGFCDWIQAYLLAETSTASTSSGAPTDLADVLPELATLFPSLGELVSQRTTFTGTSSQQSTSDRNQFWERTDVFELLSRTMARIGRGRPLVLVLEDLHASDVSVEALQYMARRLSATPTLIVGTYRSTEVGRDHTITRLMDSFRGDRRFAAMRVGPLTDQQQRELVESLLDSAPVSAGFHEKLFEVTEGNPFFTIELVHALTDSGELAANTTGELSLPNDAGISTEVFPETIQQAVEERIKRLDSAPREVLEIASVLGRTFDFRDLELLAEDVANLEDTVDWLVDVGFLEEQREPRGETIAFSSAIVRDVLYGSLSRRRRRTLHRGYAQRLERRHGAHLEQVLPQLVHHYAAGDVPDKVVGFALALAKRSLETFSADDAARAARSALEFLPHREHAVPVLEAQARVLLAASHRMAGDAFQSVLELEKAIEIFQANGATTEALDAIALAAHSAWDARAVERAERWIRDGLALARATADLDHAQAAPAPDDSPHSRLLALGSTLASLRGDFDQAAALGAELELLRAVKKPDEPEFDRSATVTFGTPAMIRAMHPVNLFTTGEQEVFANIVDTLFGTDDQGVVVPNLCERWEFADGDTVCRLTLRASIRAHNGTLVDAACVKQSFESAVKACTIDLPAAFRPLSGLSSFLDGTSDEIAGLRVTGDLELECSFGQPLRIFPSLLTDIRTAVVVEAPDASGIVGTGPFAVASFETGKVRLVRNPQPWRGSPANVAAIVFRGSLTPTEVFAGLQSGELDIGRGVPSEQLEELTRDRRRRFRILEVPGTNVWFVLFNVTGARGSDPRVRIAVDAVTRSRDLVSPYLGRFSQRAEGILPPGTLGHDPNLRRPASLPTEVDALLAPLERPIKLRAAVAVGYKGRQEYVDALLRLWKEYGIEVELIESEIFQYYDDPEFIAGIDMLIGGWGADYNDPDSYLYGVFHSEAGRARHYFARKSLDAEFEAARRTTDPRLREAQYRAIEQSILASGAMVPLYHEVEYRIVSRRLHRVRLRNTPPFVNYDTLGKTAAPPSSERRRRGGVIQVALPLGINPRTLDPAMIQTDHDVELISTVFETLTRHVDGARVVPWLAAEYVSEDSGRRYRFRLRDDVLFHNGRQLTSRDVRYSLERLLKSGTSVYRWQLLPVRGAREMIEGECDELEGFRILSRLEFTIELEQPVAFFPTLLSDPGAAIVPEGSESFVSGWRDGTAGTGPFQILRFDPAVRVELEANPTYWRQGFPRSDGVVFTFGSTPDQVAADFRAGRISLAWNLFSDDEDALLHDPTIAPGYRESPMLQTIMLVFNTRRGPFADEAARHHVIKSLDVEAIVAHSRGRLAVPATGVIPPGLLGYDPSRWSTGHDARPRPFPKEIEASTLMRPVYAGGSLAPFRTAVFEALEAIGVRATVADREGPAWEAARAEALDDLFLLGWTADYPDADSFTHGLLHSERGWVGTFCGTPEIDRLIERSRVAQDPELRHDLYREIEDLVARQALILPLYHSQMGRFARPEVHGLEVTFATPMVAYEKLWIKR